MSPRASGGVDSPTFSEDGEGQGFSTPRPLSAAPSYDYGAPFATAYQYGVAQGWGAAPVPAPAPAPSAAPAALAPVPCLLPFTPLQEPAYVPEDSRLHALLSYGYESDGAVDAELATALTSVNARNACGATPLHVAAKTAYFHGLMTLVNYGVDVDAVDDHGACMGVALWWQQASRASVLFV